MLILRQVGMVMIVTSASFTFSFVTSVAVIAVQRKYFPKPNCSCPNCVPPADES